jgi:serine/threonine protein kinase
MSEIVGQGSYGCVTKPSLKCTTDHEYMNKVSKIMTTRDAKSEQKEMELFKKIKGIEKYTMAYPELCLPKKDKLFHKVIKDCKASPVKQEYYFTGKNPEGKNISLLLLDDGGVDLYNFVTKVFHKLNDKDKSIFFTSVLNLLEGLIFFIDKKIIHHDLKLENIVYNIETGTCKYIDFGLMTTIPKFIRTAKQSKNRMATSWGYFPTELSCSNNNKFRNENKCKKYNTQLDHDEFLKRVANGFDTYSLTLALSKMFSTIYHHDTYYNEEFIEDAKYLMKEYSYSDFFKRKTDCKKLYDDYKELLNMHAVYTENVPTPSKESVEIATKLSMSNNLKTDNIIKCPPGKPDYNPYTKKCVVKCKEDKVRNDKFRCVTKKNSILKKHRKTNKVKSNNDKSKDCISKGKELNPKTNRCVKLCDKGKIRNEKFVCVSDKTKQNK